MTEENKLQKVEQQLVDERNISDSVLNKLHVLSAQGNLDIPANYSPENAIKQAWLKILETEDKNKKPALEVCTKDSIAYALQQMVTLGLNPDKNQCYFIVRGSKLCLDVSYHGEVAITKRAAGAKDVNAQVIFEGDNVTYDMEDGKIINLKHSTAFGNRDGKKIIGAYATVVFDDSSLNYTDIMTWNEIEQAWGQSHMVWKGEFKETGTHRKFPVEMTKKTITRRTCKKVRNSTDDLSLLATQYKEYEEHNRKEVFDAEVEENQATEILDIPEETTQKVQHPVPEFNADTGEILQDETEQVETQQKTSEENPF